MSFSPSGSLIAAGKKDKTVFVWDGLDTPHASKQTLEHTEYVYDVRISPDGLRLASWESKNNVIIWTRSSIGAKFEFPFTHEFDSYDAASEFLNNHSLWAAAGSPGSKTRAPAYLENTEGSVSGSATRELRFTYEFESEWVTTADGKKLWWLSEDFRGKHAQMGNKIVVYGYNYTVVFKHLDGSEH